MTTKLFTTSLPPSGIVDSGADEIPKPFGTLESVATKRRFNPNLQRVRVLLKGKATRAYVCTRCLKGGKVQKLPPRGQQGKEGPQQAG